MQKSSFISVIPALLLLGLPACTHTAEPGGVAAKASLPNVDSTANAVTISDQNEVRWNGVPVTLAQLEALFRQSAAQTPEPQIRFEPSTGASYETIVRVLEVLKTSGVKNFGFLGNDIARDEEPQRD